MLVKSFIRQIWKSPASQVRWKSFKGRGFPTDKSGKGTGDGLNKFGSNDLGSEGRPYSEIHFFTSNRTFESYPLRSTINAPPNPTTADKAILERLNGIMKPKDILAYLDRYIIGQSHAKKVIAVAVYNHYCRLRAVVQHRMALRQKKLFHISNVNDSSEPLDEHYDDVTPEKSNILLIGPSGCGKTLLAKTISHLLKVPFAMGDATSLTEAGYVGEDVDSLLYRLLENSNFNESVAQMGIIFLDEVDKISRTGGGAKGAPNSGGGRDVGGEGVQHALLKMLEGTTVQVVDRRKAGREYIPFDTSNLLFILSGAFVGLEQIVCTRQDVNSIGFNKQEITNEALSNATSPAILGKKASSWTSGLQTSDIISYGLIPEFIGRVPVLAVLENLDEHALVRTLTEPKNSLVNQYQHLFRMNCVELTFTLDALKAIGRLSVESGTGARGLRGIMEKLLLPLMFDIPSNNEITNVIIGEGFVQGTAPAEIIKKPKSHTSIKST